MKSPGFYFRSAFAILIMGVSAMACSIYHAEDELVSAETSGEEVAPPEVKDAKGNVWVLNRKIEGVTPKLDKNGRIVVPVSQGPDRDYSKMDDEELAHLLRPKMARNGHEYVLKEPDHQLVRSIRQARGTELMSPPSEMTEASLGELREELVRKVVIGNDDRVLRRDNTLYPFTTQVWNNWGCSGTMIGASTMVTAAHCVHNGHDWYRWPAYYPGVDIQDTNPYPFGGFGCYDVTIPGGWNGSTVSEDYAVVEFGTRCGLYPGNSTGWLGFYATDSGSNISGRMSYLYGYPGDKSPYPQIWGIGNTSLSTSIWYPARVFYTIDTYNGQSGSGVYQFFGEGRYVVGIHSGSYSSSENQGRWLDTAVASFIRRYSAL